MSANNAEQENDDASQCRRTTTMERMKTMEWEKEME